MLDVITCKNLKISHNLKPSSIALLFWCCFSKSSLSRAEVISTVEVISIFSFSMVLLSRPGERSGRRHLRHGYGPITAPCYSRSWKNSWKTLRLLTPRCPGTPFTLLIEDQTFFLNTGKKETFQDKSFRFKNRLILRAHY